MTNQTNRAQHIPVRRPGEKDPEAHPLQETAKPHEPAASVIDAPPAEETVDWRDMALRLRADMDNYRRRQQRLAEEQIY